MKIITGSIEVEVRVDVKFDEMSEIDIHDILMCLTSGIASIKKIMNQREGDAKASLERTLATGNHLRAELTALQRVIRSHTEGRD